MTIRFHETYLLRVCAGACTVICAGAGAIGLFLALADDARAGAFGIREQSAYAQGASFAGSATCGDSVAGMYWNPAVVACADGFDIEGSASLILPTMDISADPFPGTLFGAGSPFFNAGAPGDLGQTAVIPALTAAYNFNDHWYAGITVNQPFGLKTEANFNNAAQIYSRKSDVRSLNVNPVVGYRFNEVFALAVGAQIQYFDVKLSQAILPIPFAPTAELTGDDMGYGVTVGALITPSPDTEIGIGYRSAIKDDGPATLTIQGVGAIPATIEPTLPEMVTASIRQRITPQVSLLGTVEWTNWSRFGTLPIINNLTGAPAGFMAFEYDDGWFFSVGGEYEWTDAWTFRAGIGWEDSPVSDQVRTTLLPDDDRLWLSAGLSYDFENRLKLNLGYSYITTFDTRIGIGPGNPSYIPPVTFAGDVDGHVHVLSVGLKYSFGGDEPEQQQQAVYKP